MSEGEYVSAAEYAPAFVMFGPAPVVSCTHQGGGCEGSERGSATRMEEGKREEEDCVNMCGRV